MDNLEVPTSRPPPPPPPKRLSRPKITLQIPEATSPISVRGPPTSSTYRGQKFQFRPPGTPGSHVSDPQANPYYNPFLHMYQNKASDFMFKQFAGFKDFTMNTAKSGLSAGEKSAFWFYNKLRLLSKKWFTHFFLTLCLVLYSVVGASIFIALEGPNEDKYDQELTDIRRQVAVRIHDIVMKNKTYLKSENIDFLRFIEDDLEQYETNFTECMKHINKNDTKKKTWTFWNSMFYAGTIYTTIASKMAKAMDMELQKAFAELQVKMVETSKKIQIIDSQIHVLKRLLKHLDITQQEISTLPSDTKTYESVGRMFLLKDIEEIKNNLKSRDSQLTKKTTELENNKQYLEKNLKESEDNIREMVQQRKEQSEQKAN